MRGLLFALLVSGAALATGTARADISVSIQTPDLVYVGPGVQVIADYDEPVFFSDGFYWRYDDGLWYRSSYYTGGWEYVEAPPVRIRGVARPTAYVHYRPHGFVQHVRPLPQRRTEHYIVRPAPARVPRARPAPRYVHPAPVN